jgi:GNAT superfamily N-acetyltransferase
MHYHPLLDPETLGRIGVWEAAGRIVGVVHHEHRAGHVYFELDPEFPDLRRPMLEFAQTHLCREAAGGPALRAYIDAEDHEFESVAEELGFRKDTGASECMSELRIPEPFPPIHVPEGFALKSLADEDDLRKTHRVLHRGFDHPGEPPEEGIEGRRLMQSAPNFRSDLTVVVTAPDGSFVSFCGMWYVPERRIAYVEPVATDPAYRRRGLGTAAVLEGVRRCGELGATVAFVGTDKPFYKSMGFQEVYRQFVWCL